MSFTSTVPAINTAINTDDRRVFALAIDQLFAHQLFAVGKVRFGLRLTTSRERAIAILLETFDATNVYLAGSDRRHV